MKTNKIPKITYSLLSSQKKMTSLRSRKTKIRKKSAPAIPWLL